MRKSMIFFVALVVLLSACSQKQSAQPQQATTPEASDAEKNSQEFDSSIAEYLVNKDQNNLHYKFDRAGSNPNVYEVWIKGTKMKEVLPPYKDLFTFYDTIYMDTEAKTAIGYCYNQDNMRCRNNPSTVDLNYDDLYFKTPYDWLNEVPATAQLNGSSQIDNRNVIVIQYANTQLWVDKFYKVPLKADDHGNIWNYDVLSAKDVKDDVFVPG